MTVSQKVPKLVIPAPHRVRDKLQPEWREKGYENNNIVSNDEIQFTYLKNSSPVVNEKIGTYYC